MVALELSLSNLSIDCSPDDPLTATETPLNFAWDTGGFNKRSIANHPCLEIEPT